MTPASERRVAPCFPRWLKIGWTLWLVAWVPVYWSAYGPQSFLWFCDMGNFVLALALLRESRLLFSWQAVSLLLVQSLWTIDYVLRLATGTHFIGGTEYMFDDSLPWAIRQLSLFHAATPPVLVWGLSRLGYDRRAWLLQTFTAWVVLPLSFLQGPERDINWAWGYYDRPQAFVEPQLYLVACMALYPLLMYLPAHLVLSRWPGARGAAVSGGLTGLKRQHHPDARPRSAPSQTRV